MTFNQEGRYYVSTDASVSSNFNLHFEFSGKAKIKIGISTVSGGKPDFIENTIVDGVYDNDFNALVYPKYLTIMVSQLPTSSTITEAS